MTLEARLLALVQAIGADIKALQAQSGASTLAGALLLVDALQITPYAATYGGSLVTVDGAGISTGLVLVDGQPLRAGGEIISMS